MRLKHLAVIWISTAFPNVILAGVGETASTGYKLFTVPTEES
jgi:hypothetical protein